MKILCIGQIAYDTTLVLDDFIEENTKNKIIDKIENIGGQAFNAAYLLFKWKQRVFFIGSIGNDEIGSNIKKFLYDINFPCMLENLKESTTTSTILLNSKNASRTILTNRKIIDGLKYKDMNDKFDYILLDGKEYTLSKKILLKNLHKISLIDLEVCDDNNIELAKMCDYVICSKDFVLDFTKEQVNEENYFNIYKKLKKQFHGVIIVTIGEQGALCEINGKFKKFPSIKIDAKDTTGAGDFFHGSFLYGIVNGLSLEQSVKLATIASGLSVKKIGTINSIPTLEEVLKIYE